jgi:hypothetical protein
MQAKLYFDLQQKIQEWVDEHCEENEWPGIFVGNETIEHMTKAASSVFDACLEAEEYCRKNGCLEE